MSLAQGRQYLAIPGPSVVPDRVLQAMHRAAPNIYGGPLYDLTYSLIPDLKKIARTEGSVAIYIGNGHAAWEASLANVLSRGDKVLVLATGLFGLGWAEVARGLKAEVEVIDFGIQSDVAVERLDAALRADTTARIKAVMVCHVDTSAGVRNDILAIRKTMDAAGHGALLMVDCIASLACDVYEMDAWGADLTVAASQKGLMTPPGLGFVWFNEKAARVHETADCATGYWNWKPRANPQGYWQLFGGTAPTHHLYGLRIALDMIMEEGLENVWVRHGKLARALWAAVEAWGQGGPMAFNIKDPAKRSHAVSAFGLGAGNSDKLRGWCDEKAGLTLGIGLGREPADAYFRVGHMGHVNAQMILAAIATIDAGLKATGIPHGAGAVEAATALIAAEA